MGYNPYYMSYSMNKRNIKSFEPSEDVARMLERARRDGIKTTHILNNACREWLTKNGFARKKELCGQTEGVSL
jgi:hypothetical protein